MTTSAIVQAWIKSHPGKTILHATNGMIFIEPRFLTTPILWCLGFEEDGPRRDSPASKHMSSSGQIEAGSIFAGLQSAAMGGPTGNGFVRAGIATSYAAGVWRAYRIAKRRGVLKP
ncbi:hypothetical protein CC86DRAFT_470593 [Ophiobolus disseminans]|uniref:Uncharacterized protein n=1 Tax=Ophiobolus disseminans TaxID=1469910 RepID=A0A6A6ZJZ4_9PLEO|nr:hypothetical protein CC86DRAFT_470593 [Ophiobolus disseminans]